MIDKVQVRGFQSLYSLDLELAPFTVLVGPSNSGKSALVRALNTLTTNNSKFGAGVTSFGESVTSVRATVDDTEIAYVRDTKGVSYFLEDKKFTKLGGKVPDEVALVLRVGGINFASQFAIPYLLSESGSSVARTFGELTNVTLLFEAAREGNRRKISSRQTLKTRQEDFERLRPRLEEFSDLKDKLRIQSETEALIEKAELLYSDKTRLASMIETLSTSISALAQVPEVVVLPSLDEVQKLNDVCYRLRTLLNKAKDLIDTVKELTPSLKDLEDSIVVLRDSVEAAQEKHFESLKVCPTCGKELDR